MEESQAIQTFQFAKTKVRTIDLDGKIWFVAADVAQALGYRDAEKMVRWLDGDEKGTHNVGTLGGEQQTTIISEFGLYHAILKSRRQEAKPFRRWVTDEVLPAIRKTGSYSLNAKEQAKELPQQKPLDPCALRYSPVGVLGGLFDIPQDVLSVQGKTLPEITEAFKAAIESCRLLAGEKARPRDGYVVPEDIEREVIKAAINMVKNSLDVDVFLMASGRPVFIEAYSRDFLSITAIGNRIFPEGTVGVAKKVNELLESMGLQVQGPSSNPYWLVTEAGRQFGCYQKFMRWDQKEIVFTYWRESVIPLLEKEIEHVES